MAERPTVTRGQLLWFDLTQGIPTALKVLRQHLSRGQLAKLMLRYAWRDATTDPFRGLAPREVSPGEKLTRAQLRPALILDSALREDLGVEPERSLQILRAVVSETGARFIEHNVPCPSRAEWEALSADEQRALRDHTAARFFNMTPRWLETSDAFMAFDVTHCHFASLARELGRPEVATVFCQADQLLFDDPTRSPLRLARTETLAEGGSRCDFRFSFRDEG